MLMRGFWGAVSRPWKIWWMGSGSEAFVSSGVRTGGCSAQVYCNYGVFGWYIDSSIVITCFVKGSSCYWCDCANLVSSHLQISACPHSCRPALFPLLPREALVRSIIGGR